MRTLPLSCAAVAVVVCAGPAFAAGAPRCDAYAADAAKAALEVRQLACGFDLKDDRWSSSDPNAHKRWCRSASDDEVNQEQKERDSMVRSCEICRAYAEAALKANHDNVKYHCGLTGERWNSDEQKHFNWCMKHTFWGGVTDGEDTIETQAREAALYECEKPIQAKINFCDNYTSGARVDLRLPGVQQCLRSGVIDASQASDGRYDPSPDSRFEWCFSNYDGNWYQESNYKTRGPNGAALDPNDAVDAAITACRARNVLRTRPKDVGVSKSFEKARSGGYGNASSERGKNTGGGNESVSRAVGGGSSKLLGPGLLDGAGGSGQNAPGASGGGTTNPGGTRSGGSQNLR